MRVLVGGVLGQYELIKNELERLKYKSFKVLAIIDSLLVLVFGKIYSKNWLAQQIFCSHKNRFYLSKLLELCLITVG